MITEESTKKVVHTNKNEKKVMFIGNSTFLTEYLRCGYRFILVTVITILLVACTDSNEPVKKNNPVKEINLSEMTKMDEVKMIDKASRKAGYEGLALGEYETPLDLVMLIFKTQREGGLEKYLNYVVGNLHYYHYLEPTDEVYPRTRAVQVLDDGVLYSFRSYYEGDVFSMSVYVEKEPGEIYQAEQSLEDTFYVFNGMLSYTTVLGARKSVPSFSRAKLDLPANY